QWVLGVLPVLAHWRGKHSCLSGSRAAETRGGPFDVLAGPVIVRDQSGGGPQPASDVVSLVGPVVDVLSRSRLAQRLHWLGLFACKFDDGSVDATCRWGNRDWLAGKKTLLDICAAWPATQQPMYSRRQFVMLLPQKGDAQSIRLPTIWSRL